jgi:hypothetical protein
VASAWAEAQLLPIATRNSYFEDILLDSLIANIGETPLNSLADAEVFTDSKLNLWVKIAASAVVSGCNRRLATRVLLFCSKSSIEKDSKLGKLLKIADRSLTIKSPIITQGYNGQISHLVVTLPAYDDNDEPTLRAVSHLVTLACALHSTKPEHVALNIDKSYGEGKITISNSLSKLIDTLVSSAHHPQGLCLGEVYTYPTGFKANQVSLLAAMRLLNQKSEFVRRRKFAKDSGKAPVSYNALLETFNTMSGLRSDNSLAYTLNCVKAILSSSVKVHNRGFPGGWIHASRSINMVKSDFALVNLLGWVEKVPSQHKMLEVLFNTVDLPNETTGVKKATVINITQDKREFSHREFRTAVALSLPRIVISRRQPQLDLQLDPFSVKSLNICNNFCSDKRDLLVDRLNESYGFRVSLKNPKSKTQEIHYKMSRDRLLSESANIPLISADGSKFDSFGALPKALQKFFRDSFRYPNKKRAHDETSDSVDVSMEVDAGLATTKSSSSKKRKMTRGQVTESIRKSGRLAAQRKKT